MIISGFPGIGKSFACRKLRNKINIKDDDSNNFYNICSDKNLFNNLLTVVQASNSDKITDSLFEAFKQKLRSFEKEY